MEMESGSLAVAEVYVNCEYGYEVIAEVVCQKGTVITADDGLSVCRAKGNRSVRVPDDFRSYFADAYAKEAAAWIESILDNTIFPGADAWDGYAALVTALACGESLVEHKDIPVRMMEKPGLYGER
jgi:myo-inositol 2-dehydrogenase/D-chiro-inositol 1-dehydrogenase